MAINITKVVNEINSRVLDSSRSATELSQLFAASSRIENSGVNALTYRSTGHLPSTADSNNIGSLAFVEADNVFGDSSGRFYYASSRDSGWLAITTAQDSDEATITAPSGAAEPSVRQAANYGFTAGGKMPAIGAPWNYIQKFALASDANATDVGDTTDYKTQNVGASSSTHGYSMGGFIGYGPNNPSTTNVIEKWSHTSDGNAVDAGDLLAATRMGSSAFSPTDGFHMAGYIVPGSNLDTIQKFPFASDGNTADTNANILVTTRTAASCMSSTHGYVLGGYPSGPTAPGDYVDVIQKFPFASGSDATDVGNLLAGNSHGDGKQSDTHGYHSGGNGAVPAPGARNEIQKFTLASDADATDVGNLTVSRYPGASLGVASTASGYTAGGASPYVNTIDKHSLSSDGDATDVGDMLSPALQYATSQN